MIGVWFSPLFCKPRPTNARPVLERVSHSYVFLGFIVMNHGSFGRRRCGTPRCGYHTLELGSVKQTWTRTKSRPAAIELRFFFIVYITIIVFAVIRSWPAQTAFSRSGRLLGAFLSGFYFRPTDRSSIFFGKDLASLAGCCVLSACYACYLRYSLLRCNRGRVFMARGGL